MSLYSSKIKFKPRQRRLTVGMVTDFVSLSTTSKRCFEQPAASFLTTSVPYTTSKRCFEQPAASFQPEASFLVCSLIFIEY
ncbi:hypothetical protein PNI0212_01853 [Streptococcus pneumoniae PNI0212]|nr:hypothetical protein PNI0212_01853 [Streptococcus pneumoniae PNI0212]